MSRKKSLRSTSFKFTEMGSPVYRPVLQLVVLAKALAACALLELWAACIIAAFINSGFISADVLLVSGISTGGAAPRIFAAALAFSAAVGTLSSVGWATRRYSGSTTT